MESNGKNQTSRKIMNTIQRLQTGQPVRERRSLGITHIKVCPSAGARVTEAPEEAAHVVGGSGSGKDGVVNAGDLRDEESRETAAPAGVRVAIVASKPGNAGGAKGGRKAKPFCARTSEVDPRRVPATDRQGGSARWLNHRVERTITGERMLAAPETGLEGRKSTGRMTDEETWPGVLQSGPGKRCRGTQGTVAWAASRWSASTKTAEPAACRQSTQRGLHSTRVQVRSGSLRKAEREDRAVALHCLPASGQPLL